MCAEVVETHARGADGRRAGRMAPEIARYCDLICRHLVADYRRCFREPGAPFEYPFLTPGSKCYADVLWDWDSWLSNVALRQILAMIGSPESYAEARSYERGCVLNFLSWCDMDGWIPISASRGEDIAAAKPANFHEHNMHKPVLAQHAAFLVQQDNGDAEWLRDRFEFLQAFINNYRHHHRHRCGLYYWQNDVMIGVDNDPCTYFRPPRSSAAIFLNCIMYKELRAMVYLCERLGLHEVAADYAKDAEYLRAAIDEHCWDERDGFFYSLDINLLPDTHVHGLHMGMPRHWEGLIQRIGVWSGFLALWAGIASPRQAERVVREHYRNPETFNAPFGVRSLSKMEKMYSVRATNNPSNWLGPVWGIVNYMVFRALVNYEFEDDARELAEKTIRLFGRDLDRFGALHEYYQPDNGEPILNRGFQNWNYLVLNMIAWYRGEPCVVEF
ncbi:MAG TPA: trehalase family glycosidase [Phycisphaerae bacterium]|nr:trehalase family glycosidase [Phycisphaerae bacterium]